jgi:hypothetical protein
VLGSARMSTIPVRSWRVRRFTSQIANDPPTTVA